MKEYKQCPCQDCAEADKAEAGVLYDCGCDNGPVYQCAGCPRQLTCLAIKDLENCPQCNSWEGIKFPRNNSAYCEDCGWPDEDFDSKECAKGENCHDGECGKCHNCLIDPV